MTIRELCNWVVANGVEDFQLGETFSNGIEIFEMEDFTVDTENNLISINN